MASTTSIPASGPSSSAAFPSTAPTPSHPAFPALIPRSQTQQSTPKPRLPTTDNELIIFLQTYASHDQVIEIVIPALSAIAAGRLPPSGGGGGAGGGGKDLSVDLQQDGEKERSKTETRKTRGEELLRLSDWALETVADENLHSMAAVGVFVLAARMHNASEETGLYNVGILDAASRIIAIGHVEQLRACGPRLATLAWGLVDLGKRFKRLDDAILLLEMLIQKCYGGPGLATLSGVHAAFLHACLLTRRYQHAQPVIEGVYVDVKQSKPSYRDVITFYHHAGLISAAIGNFEKAVDMFSICVSITTTVPSAIQIAAAKRAFLCGILYNGELVRFPKYTSSSITRMIERHCSAYTKLCSAYAASDWIGVRNSMDHNDFKDDTNLGLVDQVVSSMPARRVLQLQKTHSKMYLSDLARRLGFKSDAQGQERAARLLQGMHETGTLRVSMGSADSPSTDRIVAFLPAENDFNSPEALERLKRDNELALALHVEMRKSARELGLSVEDLRKQSQHLESKGGGKGKGKGQGQGPENPEAELAGEGRKIRGVGGNLGDMGF